METSIHEITYGPLEDFALWPGKKGLKPKTRRNVVAAFRAFLTWLHRRGEIREVPRAPMPKGPEYEPRILPAVEQDRVLAEVPEADRGIFHSLAHLGLRPGEARALDASDYHDGWITVDKAVKGKSASSPIRGTKSGKPKRLPVGEDLADWIERNVPRDQRLRAAPLFVNRRTGGRYAHKPLVRPGQGPCGMQVSLMYRPTRAQAQLCNRRHPTRCSRASLATILGPCVGHFDAPLRATRRHSARRSVAASNEALATRVPRANLRHSAVLRVGPRGFEVGGPCAR